MKKLDISDVLHKAAIEWNPDWIRPKERPILFSGPMVQALLAGRKTQTRRVVKPQPDGVWGKVPATENRGENFGVRPVIEAGKPWWHRGGVNGLSKCPYGQPGERLWVRETFASSKPQLVAYKADGWCGALIDVGNGGDVSKEGIVQFQHGWIVGQSKNDGTYRPLSAFGGKWKPSIYMPRWASRIMLEVTDVRVQRVKEISEEDAEAEGINAYRVNVPQPKDSEFKVGDPLFSCVSRFQKLWDSINGARGYGWEANPWVWAITFRRLKS